MFPKSRKLWLKGFWGFWDGSKALHQSREATKGLCKNNQSLVVRKNGVLIYEQLYKSANEWSWNFPNQKGWLRKLYSPLSSTTWTVLFHSFEFLAPLTSHLLPTNRMLYSSAGWSNISQSAIWHSAWSTNISKTSTCILPAASRTTSQGFLCLSCQEWSSDISLNSSSASGSTALWR